MKDEKLNMAIQREIYLHQVEHGCELEDQICNFFVETVASA